MHVSGARRTITKAGQHRLVRAIALDAHRVAHRVQGMGADDDGEDPETDLMRIPAGVRHTAIQVQQVHGVNVTHLEDTDLAITGEAKIRRTHGVTRTDLCALLAQDRTPQSQLTRALQRRGLHVQATGQGDVAIERAQALMIAIQRVVRVIVSLPIRTEELDDVFGHGGTPSSRAS